MIFPTAARLAPVNRRGWLALHERLIGWLSALVGALPLIVTAPAPLVDWQGHLARVWVIHRVLQGDPFWTARYVFRGFLIPNAILDLVLVGLQQAGLAVQAAGALYLLSLYAVFMGGFHRLAKAARADSTLTLPLAAACFYTLPLFWGFVNFMTGVAVMMWLLAWYVQARTDWQRLAIVVLGGAVVTFCHIIAACLFVGVIGCLDLVRARSEITAVSRSGERALSFRFSGQLCRRAAALIADAALRLWRAQGRAPRVMMPSCLGAVLVAGALFSSPVAGNSLRRIVYRGHGSALGIVFGKASIWGKTLLSLNAGPDILLVLAVITAAILVWRLRPTLQLSWAAAAAALAGVSLAAPDWIGSSAFLDARIPAVAVIVLVATTSLRGARGGLALILCVLLAGRSLWLATDFMVAGRTYTELEAALSGLPPGSTLLAGEAQPDVSKTWWSYWPPPITIMVAHGVFVPQMFASPVQQPLVLRPKWEAWNYFRELCTQQRVEAAVAEARAICDGPTSLILFYPAGVPAGMMDGRLPGDLGRSLRLVKAC